MPATVPEVAPFALLHGVYTVQLVVQPVPGFTVGFASRTRNGLKITCAIHHHHHVRVASEGRRVVAPQCPMVSCSITPDTRRLFCLRRMLPSWTKHSIWILHVPTTARSVPSKFRAQSRLWIQRPFEVISKRERERVRSATRKLL